MSRHASDPELKTEFAARIKELLVRFTAKEIAQALSVKRQMVYNYRDGKNAPSPEIIRRAMESWPELVLCYRGKVLTLQDFNQKPVVKQRAAVQYELWDAIKKLDAQSVEIEILDKAASSVQFGITIRFPSQLKKASR